MYSVCVCVCVCVCMHHEGREVHGAHITQLIKGVL